MSELKIKKRIYKPSQQIEKKQARFIKLLQDMNPTTKTDSEKQAKALKAYVKQKFKKWKVLKLNNKIKIQNFISSLINQIGNLGLIIQSNLLPTQKTQKESSEAQVQTLPQTKSYEKSLIDFMRRRLDTIDGRSSVKIYMHNLTGDQAWQKLQNPLLGVKIFEQGVSRLIIQLKQFEKFEEEKIQDPLEYESQGQQGQGLEIRNLRQFTQIDCITTYKQNLKKWDRICSKIQNFDPNIYQLILFILSDYRQAAYGLNAFQKHLKPIEDKRHSSQQKLSLMKRKCGECFKQLEDLKKQNSSLSNRNISRKQEELSLFSKEISEKIVQLTQKEIKDKITIMELEKKLAESQKESSQLKKKLQNIREALSK